MCIAYGRATFIKRTEGRCAAQLGAYLARICLEFEGSCVREAEVFDYSEKNLDHVYHDIMLPEGADEKFKDAELLWNYVSKKEKRIDAQESFHYVLALPKEEWIKKEELVEMTRLFCEQMFVSKGLITQVDIHWKDGNPHAHFHGVQRTLSGDGKELSDSKEEGKKVLRELVQMRQAKVVQNFYDSFFESKGWDLRCDLPGIIPQIHLGQEGAWGRALDLFLDNRERVELNGEFAKNPKHVLLHISKFHSVFSADDVNRFIEKHTPEDFQDKVKRSFWNQSEIIQMIDKKTGKKIDLFSTRDVILEENRLERVLSSLQKRETLYAQGKIDLPEDLKLSFEQKEAFRMLTEGHGVAVLQGFAGTGKSYVLKAVSDGFEKAGTTVVTLGADNAAANSLSDKGLDATNVFRFLYQKKYQNFSIPKNSVFILDEAGKLDNSTFLEFMKVVKRNKGVVIFSGDRAQIPAVQRGGAFDHAFETCKTVILQPFCRH